MLAQVVCGSAEWDRLIAHDTVECLQLLPLPPDPSPSGSLVNPRLVQSLRTARENGQLCDMQLVSSDGACFPAHWLIIAAQTPVLADAVQVCCCTLSPPLQYLSYGQW